MTALQYHIITALAVAAAASILLFDRTGRTHKPAASVLAWLVFCQMGCLALAAIIRAEALAQWFLIGGLAVHAVNIVLAKGNINRVRPHLSVLFRRHPPLASHNQASHGEPKPLRHKHKPSRHYRGNKHA